MDFKDYSKRTKYTVIRLIAGVIIAFVAYHIGELSGRQVQLNPAQEMFYMSFLIPVILSGLAIVNELINYFIEQDIKKISQQKITNFQKVVYEQIKSVQKAIPYLDEDLKQDIEDEIENLKTISDAFSTEYEAASKICQWLSNKKNKSRLVKDTVRKISKKYSIADAYLQYFYGDIRACVNWLEKSITVLVPYRVSQDNLNVMAQALKQGMPQNFSVYKAALEEIKKYNELQDLSKNKHGFLEKTISIFRKKSSRRSKILDNLIDDLVRQLEEEIEASDI